MIKKSRLTHIYLELLKKSLLNELYIENEARIILTLSAIFNSTEVTFQDLFNIKEHDYLFEQLEENKQNGSCLLLCKENTEGLLEKHGSTRNYTELSHTMIGKKRLNNIQFCVESILEEDIPGDLIETGIWRGGATIFMRGILEAYGVTNRSVWVADSFEGVPSPSYAEDCGCDISASVLPVLAVSLDEVLELFERYGLLDAQVNFIQGWFKNTLETAPIDKLAILRLDGDLYESTMDALNPLYSKVSSGGFIIVDDYFSCPPCKRAIDEFRTKHAIHDGLVQIDDQSVYWRKS
jgi:O-methyltransferase